MSKFLKFIVHFAVICTIVCVLGLALPPFFGVRTVIMDSTDKATNLPLGSVTYAIPVRTEEVTAGSPILVQEDGKTYKYNLVSVNKENNTGTVIDTTTSAQESITVSVKNWVPKIVITIPFVGYLLVATESVEGLIVLGLVILFLIIFTGYLLWMIRSVKRARRKSTPDALSSMQEERISLSEEEIEQVTSHINLLPAWKCLIFILGGMIAIKYGGDFVVDGASAIAVRLGLSQTLIGLTIIAMGTSLPELVTSIVAARKDEVDMALGNVIGSNIFNILLVLGVAAAISPVAFAWDNMIDIAVLIVISAITLIFAWTSKELNRREGIIMLILYAAYMVYICIR